MDKLKREKKRENKREIKKKESHPKGGGVILHYPPHYLTPRL